VTVLKNIYVENWKQFRLNFIAEDPPTIANHFSFVKSISMKPVSDFWQKVGIDLTRLANNDIFALQ
jgi:hypothetical protein